MYKQFCMLMYIWSVSCTSTANPTKETGLSDMNNAMSQVLYIHCKNVNTSHMQTPCTAHPCEHIKKYNCLLCVKVGQFTFRTGDNTIVCRVTPVFYSLPSTVCVTWCGLRGGLELSWSSCRVSWVECHFYEVLGFPVMAESGQLNSMHLYGLSKCH